MSMSMFVNSSKATCFHVLQWGFPLGCKRVELNSLAFVVVVVVFARALPVLPRNVSSRAYCPCLI